MQSDTLSQVLHKAGNSGNRGITFIEKSNSEAFLAYGELYQKALRGASFLREKGMQPQDELVFQLDDNQTFIVAFWACILGGFIPVPLSVGQNDDHKQKLFSCWPVLCNPFLIAPDHNRQVLSAFARHKGLDAQWAAIDGRRVDPAGLLAAGPAGQLHPAQADDIALIQFSSGSTGDPKGVTLTHQNLIANMEAIGRAARYSPDDSMLSWMPLTHDMGMIGLHLNPLLYGMNQYLMPTALFIRRPALWLDKASEHRVSILCSPNFGYKYVLKHCQPDGRGWDLSGVRLLYNGAEPISESLCRQFVDALAPYGLPRGAMRPVYGLAEASLAVTISDLGDEVRALRVDRHCTNPGDQVVERQDDNAVAFVNVGKAIDCCALRIAGDDGTPLPERTVGHVEIKGGSVTRGYYNNEAATRQAITPDGWLRTGDLGFLSEDALYITGRAKDIIFVNGQNYYPHDLERVAEAVPGIELNKIAVAGFFNPRTQQEEAIAFVFHRGSDEEFVPVARAVKALINDKVGLELDQVVPVRDMPRTTSGKLQRFRLLEAYRRGDYDGAVQAIHRLMAATAAAPPPDDQPRNATEARLLAVWQAILPGVTGVSQKFFETGGNSLRAAELAMSVGKEFGVELSPAVLSARPTVRELAAHLAGLPRSEYTPIPVRAPGEHYPASSAQKRLYYAWEANPTAT
ncbi:MAG TPA: non-ribosomal peptide synthetase, partial [Cytophagales bacterium]